MNSALENATKPGANPEELQPSNYNSPYQLFIIEPIV